MKTSWTPLNGEKKKHNVLRQQKVTVEDVEQAVWKAVEEKIAAGEFHPKKEE